MPFKAHGGSKKGPWIRKKAAKPKCSDPLIEESDVSFTELSEPISSGANMQKIVSPT